MFIFMLVPNVYTHKETTKKKVSQIQRKMYQYGGVHYSTGGRVRGRKNINPNILGKSLEAQP